MTHHDKIAAGLAHVVEQDRRTFTTVTGRRIDVLDPQPEDIHVDDIIVALARTTRFNGLYQSQAIYSVAQHSVLVARACPAGAKPWGLMHDAAEAYIGDVISPLKRVLGQTYALIEEAFEAAICERFGVRRDPNINRLVKLADRRVYLDEQASLRNILVDALPAHETDVRPLGNIVTPWGVPQAEEAFCGAYSCIFDVSNFGSVLELHLRLREGPGARAVTTVPVGDDVAMVTAAGAALR